MCFHTVSVSTKPIIHSAATVSIHERCSSDDSRNWSSTVFHIPRYTNKRNFAKSEACIAHKLAGGTCGRCGKNLSFAFHFLDKFSEFTDQRRTLEKELDILHASCCFLSLDNYWPVLYEALLLS